MKTGKKEKKTFFYNKYRQVFQDLSINRVKPDTNVEGDAFTIFRRRRSHMFSRFSRDLCNDETCLAKGKFKKFKVYLFRSENGCQRSEKYFMSFSLMC